MIAQAQSGTGKTATFAISVLQSLDVNAKECQSLILAPTRELAQQIQKVGNSITEIIGCSLRCGRSELNVDFDVVTLLTW